jgi:hypothetical protein
MWARALIAILIAASFAPAQTTKSKATAPPKAKTPVKQKTPAKATAATPAKPAAPPVPVPALAAGRALPPPKDESTRDPSLVAFYARLKDILKRKDRPGLEALLAPDIDAGIAGTRGPGIFYTAWDLGDPNSSVYAVITQILSLPGVWQGEQFCGPYVAAQFPPGLDPWKYQVALNHDVRLRETPSTSAKTVALLPYSIVEILERGEWTRVRTESGLEGYVQVAYLYSPAAYRLCAAKNAAGEWKIQSVLAGPLKP